MKKMKYLRTWLVVALVVTIIGSLTGGTVAWFTDNVESTGNKIEAGTLNIDMLLKRDGKWISLEKEENANIKVFDYNLWEPGYTQVETLTIANKGNLALEYILNVSAPDADTFVDEEGNTKTLANAIDVYMAFGEVAETTTRADIVGEKNGWWKAGNLAGLMGSTTGFTQGKMLPSGAEEGIADGTVIESGLMQGFCTCTIALHMQEEAGNEYQNLSLGNVGFKLQAKQYTYEEDSFDDQYDVEPPYGDGVIIDEVPLADVSKMTPEEMSSITFIPQNGETERPLDVGYIFKTTESYDEAQQNPYAKWHADYVVTLDKEVPAMSLGLVGSYASYQNGAWIGFDLTQDIIDEVPNNNGNLPAHTEFRLLDAFGVTMNYEELCLLVEEFKCGAYAIGDAANGVKMTVQLRLYEVEEPSESNGNSWNIETGKYITDGAFVYTFGK